MIKYLLFLLLLLVPSTSYAQFPVTITVSWDPNPVIENVTSYTISLDSGQSNSVNPSTRCTATECTFQLVIPSSGNHTIRVVALNIWGSSLPTDFTFNANSPGKSGNIRIRIP
jgi:hypothetical protein